MVTNVRLSELIRDYTLYPRSSIDRTHVSHMVDAMEAGVELPPVIVDKASMRLVDGFHRSEAGIIVYGDTGSIRAEMRQYPNEKELFLDAVRLNSPHGVRLNTHDRVRCACVARQLGIPLRDISAALSLSKSRLKDLLSTRTAIIKSIKPAGNGTPPKQKNCGATTTPPAKQERIVPLKASISHMAGKKLSAVQRDANERLGGMRPRFYVNQVVLLLESDLIDLEDTGLVDSLRTELRTAISAWEKRNNL